MAQEPSLSEIENINADPQLGTGTPAVLVDNSQLLQTINQNAQFRAQNDWNKYQQFLKDYETRLKTQQDIADKEVLDSDREHLKKRSIDIMKDALSDPYKIYSPELNTKLANLRADATSSKTARDYAEMNIKQMLVNPSLNNDENKAIVKDYIENQTIEKGGRKTFMLSVPDVLDRDKYFNDLAEASAQEDAYAYDDNEGHQYEGKIKKYDRNIFLEKIKLGYDENKKIQKIAKEDFESLPPSVKSNFEDAKDYWLNYGAKHWKGLDDYEVRTAAKIEADPQYTSDLDRYIAKTQRMAVLNKAPDSATAQMPDNGNIIYGINAEYNGGEQRLVNGTFVDKNGDVIKADTELLVPSKAFDNSIISEFDKYAGKAPKIKVTNKNTGEVTYEDDPSNEPSRLEKNKAGYYTIKIKDGVVQGIKTNKGDYAQVDQFEYITNQANIRGKKPYTKSVDISGGNKPNDKVAPKKSALSNSKKEELRKKYGV